MTNGFKFLIASMVIAIAALLGIDVSQENDIHRLQDALVKQNQFFHENKPVFHYSPFQYAPVTPAPAPDANGNATVNGNNSVANTGNGNTFTMGRKLFDPCSKMDKRYVTCTTGDAKATGDGSIANTGSIGSATLYPYKPASGYLKTHKFTFKGKDAPSVLMPSVKQESHGDNSPNVVYGSGDNR